MSNVTIASITMTSLELVDFINEDRKARAKSVGAIFPSPALPSWNTRISSPKCPRYWVSIHRRNFPPIFLTATDARAAATASQSARHA